MVYSSPRLAQAYADDRPPVHPPLLASVTMPVADRALDIGCGAGLSALALQPYARHVVGLDPSVVMLAVAHQAPFVRYVAGCAEHIPFADNSFGLVTAGGSLNYAAREVALKEIERVLMPGGRLVLCDFWCASLPQWWEEFERRYPSSPGYHMEPLSSLDYAEGRVTITMTQADFIRHALSETDVEEALMRGVPLESIRDWCSSSLTECFGGQHLEIHFDG
jgi:SAM-dependent methyltransferase